MTVPGVSLPTVLDGWITGILQDVRDSLVAAGVDQHTPIRLGTAAADNNVGANGEFYVRTSTGVIYKKNAGAWSAVGTLAWTPA